jgi:hypothetical protein
VSMELDDDTKLDYATIKPVSPDYPYGLKICLCEDEIGKLDLPDDVKAGEYLFFKARACVTNAGTEKMADGVKRRVELQIEDMQVLGKDKDEYE